MGILCYCVLAMRWQSVWWWVGGVWCDSVLSMNWGWGRSCMGRSDRCDSCGSSWCDVWGCHGCGQNRRGCIGKGEMVVWIADSWSHPHLPAAGVVAKSFNKNQRVNKMKKINIVQDFLTLFVMICTSECGMRCRWGCCYGNIFPWQNVDLIKSSCSYMLYDVIRFIVDCTHWGITYDVLTVALNACCMPQVL